VVGIGKDDPGAVGVLDAGSLGPEAGYETGLLGLEQKLSRREREIHEVLVKVWMGVERGTPGPVLQVQDSRKA